MSLAKRLIAVAVSAVLFGILLWSVDRAALAEVLARARLGWFALGMVFFVPQVLAIGHRWQLIARPVARLDWREAGRQVLASNCLNLVLPSKLGDLAKGVFLYRQGRCALADGMQVVVFEKLLDVAALCVWMVVGWVLMPRGDGWVVVALAGGGAVVVLVYAVYFLPGGAGRLLALMPAGLRKGKLGRALAAAPAVARLVHADGGRRTRILAWSFAIWLLHLLQIACFFRAVGVEASLVAVLALMPVAIFAGLMPLTIAGIGVRDWAIVALFAGAGNPREVLVAAGLLVSLRYVVPAAGGLPWVGRYLTMARGAATGRG
ncbi:MAG: flippase-like domain-containing protein [Candidatus Sumerlaeia bacterium]|nr:flippase-like domain-containing protein [Candidatus Sumerlaeia bacterium]